MASPSSAPRARTIPAKVAGSAILDIVLPPSLFSLRGVWRHPATKTIRGGSVGVANGAGRDGRALTQPYPLADLSFSFCALIDSRALVQSSSLQSRSW